MQKQLFNYKKKLTKKKLDSKSKVADNNKVNELTGSEWKFATKSVISKAYPVNLQHKLRSEHGGQKPPDLCLDLIKIFTKKNNLVLDPLMGVGGTLIGASLCNRKAVGIELNNKWINIYKKVCKLEKIKAEQTYHGNAKEVLEKNIKNNSIDFILTDVPYWNVDQLKKTRSKKATISKLSKFNKSNSLSKEDWLLDMKEIFQKCFKKLKNKKYMGVFIGDIYRDKHYHILSADLANSISTIEGFNLKANLIWFDQSKSLHVYGYPYSFVPSMIHQNVLIFKKEIDED